MTARRIYRDSIEYLTVTVTASATLDTQPVEISADDKATWLSATWTGAANTTRSCQVLLNGTNMPAAGERPIYVRLTDSPEIPVFGTSGTVRFI